MGSTRQPHYASIATDPYPFLWPHLGELYPRKKPRARVPTHDRAHCARVPNQPQLRMQQEP